MLNTQFLNQSEQSTTYSPNASLSDSHLLQDQLSTFGLNPKDWTLFQSLDERNKEEKDFFLVHRLDTNFILSGTAHRDAQSSSWQWKDLALSEAA
jgi:hypothetical protein